MRLGFSTRERQRLSLDDDKIGKDDTTPAIQNTVKHIRSSHRDFFRKSNKLPDASPRAQKNQSEGLATLKWRKRKGQHKGALLRSLLCRQWQLDSTRSSVKLCR